MTQQPEWELVGNLGDINVVDCGGFLVYHDKTGVYQPEVELYEPWNDSDKPHGGMMYRFILEPPRFKTFKRYIGTDGREYQYQDRTLLDFPSERGSSWHWYCEWWVKYLDSIATSAGTTKFHLLRELFSTNPMQRASAYCDIVGHFGPDEFDSYPVELTEVEAQARYARLQIAK